MKLKLKAIDFHRNGISGEPFYVALFTEIASKPGEDNSEKIAIRFDYDDVQERKVNRIAVLDVDMLTGGSIEFGVNSWRGDHYVEAMDRWIAEWQRNLSERCAGSKDDGR